MIIYFPWNGWMKLRVPETVHGRKGTDLVYAIIRQIYKSKDPEESKLGPQARWEEKSFERFFNRLTKVKKLEDLNGAIAQAPARLKLFVKEYLARYDEYQSTAKQIDVKSWFDYNNRTVDLEFSTKRPNRFFEQLDFVPLNKKLSISKAHPVNDRGEYKVDIYDSTFYLNEEELRMIPRRDRTEDIKILLQYIDQNREKAGNQIASFVKSKIRHNVDMDALAREAATLPPQAELTQLSVDSAKSDDTASLVSKLQDAKKKLLPRLSTAARQNVIAASEKERATQADEGSPMIRPSFWGPVRPVVRGTPELAAFATYRVGMTLVDSLETRLVNSDFDYNPGWAKFLTFPKINYHYDGFKKLKEGECYFSKKYITYLHTIFRHEKDKSDPSTSRYDLLETMIRCLKEGGIYKSVPGVLMLCEMYINLIDDSILGYNLMKDLFEQERKTSGLVWINVEHTFRKRTRKHNFYIWVNV